ncbi:MAG: trypsin-like serine protease, partial [Myxococcales bacterium]|nr:trypsin-like serine protease [Myxococcales bacterium]
MPSLSAFGRLTLALAVVAALACSACSAESDRLGESRAPIINGTASSASSLPSVGALVALGPQGWSAFCSGTLISSRMVLTAAHCIANIPAGVTVGFYIGGNDVRVGGQVLAVSARIAHPSYNAAVTPTGLGNYFDIGVLTLAQPFTAIAPSKLVRPAEVKALVKQSATVLIAGFGLTQAGGTVTGKKYEGYTTMVDIGASEVFIIGAQANRPQKCNGDSGGPTFGDLDSGPGLDLRVVGVASRAGTNCTIGSIETRVDSYLPWLHQQGTIPCDSGLSPPCNPTGDIGVADATVDLTRDFGVPPPPDISFPDVPPPPPPPPPPPLKQFGEKCTISSECVTGLCINGYCNHRCGPNLPCPAGWVCHAQALICTVGTTPPPP